MYQPIFPLRLSESDGAYESHKDISQTIKQNVLFLLNTSPGEWPGRPDMGVGVRRFLFEHPNSREWMNLSARVSQQFKKYMPFLSVRSEVVENSDDNSMILVVRYDIKSLNIEDTVTLSLSQKTSG